MLNRLKGILLIIVATTIVAFLSNCGGDSSKSDPNDPMQNKGIGPVKKVELGNLDGNMVNEGKKIFDNKCSACHKTDQRYIGPAIKGVTSRRSPEWIMNMIMNPEEMVQKDPIAKQLLQEYISPMANQGITEPEARKILEYFRTLK